MTTAARDEEAQLGIGEGANAWDRAAYFAGQAVEKSAAAVNASLKAAAASRQVTDDDSHQALRRAANASLRAYNASREAADASVKAAKASREAANAMERADDASERAANRIAPDTE